MTVRRTSPNLALLVIASIATMGFIDRIVVNVLVEPLKTEFALTDAQVSLMGIAFAALNITVGFVSARYAERVRRVTLIAFGTIFWSVATALCGAAGSWVQLLVARMGVGLGEAIGIPSNQSVVADYFPANRRGFAISCLLLSPPLGAFIGFVVGGWIAQEFDWRMTFFIAAIPGLALGVIAYLFVEEPPRGAHDVECGADDVPPFSAVLRRLFGLPSARNLMFGLALGSMAGFGINYFFTSLLIRRFGIGLAEAGLYGGVIASLPAALSVVGAGWLGDRLGERRPAAYALIPAAMLAIGGPLYALAVTRDALWPLLTLVGVATFFTFGFLGITNATLQNLMHPRMRATASATFNLTYGIAGGIGPLLLGLLSDRFAVQAGEARGLALAMAAFTAIYLWAALHYLNAARHLARDMRGLRRPQP